MMISESIMIDKNGINGIYAKNDTNTMLLLLKTMLVKMQYNPINDN